MNREAQRIAIAKACNDLGVAPGENCWDHDYPGDLNAMHGAEKSLAPEQFTRYADVLCDLVAGDDPDPNVEGLIHLSAEVRAEAFLKTLGLWEVDR